MKEKFYLTTAIAYSSAIPHIGNVYEAVLADAIARFKRLDGYDVYFQTGTDEHGQKIESKAKNHELTPKQYVDHISSEIKRIYDDMKITYDSFVRTTDSNHVKGVQAIFKKLFDQGDIYLSKYEGWYVVSEESFVLEKDLIDGKCANGEIPIWTSEDAYFLKLSKYQKQLVDHIKKNPSFIEPDSRRNEMVENFLKEELPDLCVSRTSFSWGIPVEFDKGHVVYVWLDALSNYITGLGYNPNEKMTNEFKKYWPADVHIIGKDILRFHTIYWPIMLIALNIELPKKIFGHPWILFDKNKMSKSVGNVIYTDDLSKHFSIDTIRYYVLHEIPYANDGNLTYELIIERNNSDLANTIGNLINRTIGMINKYNEGNIEKVMLEKEPFEISLKEKSLLVLPKMREYFNDLKVADALEEILKLARFANKYIDLSEPWNLFKNNQKETLNHVLYSLLETSRFIAILLQPFIPDTANKIAFQLKIKDLTFESLDTFGVYNNNKIGIPEVLFERYDSIQKIEEILKGQEKNGNH